MRSKTKVAILSSASGGGAGIAARRLADLLNLTESYCADFIDIIAIGEAVPEKVTLKDNSSNRKLTDTHFTAEYPGFIRGWLIELLSNYDVINVHWASYLVTTSEIIVLAEQGKKLLITMHDFYYSTGGCHYQAGCTGQYNSCIACPQIDTNVFSYTAVMDAYKEKIKLFSYTNVHLSAPSKYLIDKVVSTGIIDAQRTHVIRNIYQPEEVVFIDKQAVKSHVLLIADSLLERRKGMSLALKALSLATAKFDGDLIVHLVGYADDQLRKLCSEYKINAVFYGRITEHTKLAELYQNVGVLLTCSYEDNWPNILVEAGAYGVVPVVGSSHGCEEFCKLFNIGRLGQSYTPEAFSASIINCIEDYPQNIQLQTYAINVRLTHSSYEIICAYGKVISAISDKYRLTEPSRLFDSVLDKKSNETFILNETEGPFSASAFNFSSYGICGNL